ncbi:MAG: acyloxyacyl hydrolase [Pseudomonadota bacterium]
MLVATTSRQAKTQPHRWRQALTCVALICLGNSPLFSTRAYAQFAVPVDYRVATADDNFDGVDLYAFAFQLDAGDRWRIDSIEIAAGLMTDGSTQREFLSVGPVWTARSPTRRWFARFGFSPTLLAGSTIAGRDLGGNFHFTSSLSLGVAFGQRRAFELALRAQHTSNGGLASTNPGIDFFGVNVRYAFDAI